MIFQVTVFHHPPKSSAEPFPFTLHAPKNPKPHVKMGVMSKVARTGERWLPGTPATSIVEGLVQGVKERFFVFFFGGGEDFYG